MQEARRPGLAALFAVAGINPDWWMKISWFTKLRRGLIAAGRLGDGSTAVRLLLSREQEETAALARELDQPTAQAKENE